MSSLKEICVGIPTDPLPRARERDESVAHAPVRTPNLSHDEQRVSPNIFVRSFVCACMLEFVVLFCRVVGGVVWLLFLVCACVRVC